MEDIFTNLTKGYTDKEIKKDNIYQSGINELERTFPYKPEELSVKTIKLEPFYSNLFQSLISDEAEKRFEKAFYKTESKKRKSNETIEDLNKFIDNLQDVIYEIDNVKSIETFPASDAMVNNDGFKIHTNDGHSFQVVITQES